MLQGRVDIYFGLILKENLYLNLVFFVVNCFRADFHDITFIFT